MDRSFFAISAAELYSHLGTASEPILVGVRRQEAFDADDGEIVGALRHAPEEVGRWSRDLPLAAASTTEFIRVGSRK